MNQISTKLSRDPAINALLSLAIEGWRFTRSYLRLIPKLDAGEQSRFVSQCRYFQKHLEERIHDIGYKLVHIEGQRFDPGMAATAINMSDFSAEDKLVVEQMLEPIIMNKEGVSGLMLSLLF